MRLIDADALKQFEITMPRGDGYSDFVFAGHIHQAPTIDAVPVVRCKDCKYYDPPFEVDGKRFEGDCGFHEWYRAAPEEYDFVREEKGERMYSLCSVSIWNKSTRAAELTPADALKIVKYGSTNLGKVLVTNYWGIFRRLQDAMEELKEIPASHYQSYLEGRGNDGSYRYIWEGVILYEDGRAICAFNEPWRGRRG